MKLNVKTLEGKTFSIEVEPTESVGKLKSLIEELQGPAFPAASQKLIFSGKILKDDALLSEWSFKATDFIVCMVTKAKAAKRPSTQPATPSVPSAAPAEIATTTPDAQPSTAVPISQTPSATSAATPAAVPATSGLVVGEELSATVRQLCDMGFPEDQVQLALQAAFNNPERAVEYLMNGIPTNEAAAPRDAAASGSANPLEALRMHPQFPALRQVVQENPSALPALMRQIGAQSPELMQIINQNREAFLQLLNETEPPQTTSTSAVPPQQQNAGQGGLTDPQQVIQYINSLPAEQQQQMAAQMGINLEQLQQMTQVMATLPPDAMQQMFNRGAAAAPAGYATVQLTQDENAAVGRLTEMGFERNDVIQAYLACDKNEALAANFLMDSMNADFDAGGTMGADEDDIYE